MRRSLLALFLLTLAPPAAFAQGGIDLYWNDCGAGGTGVTNRTFACNSDTGDPFTMYVSVYAPVEMPQFVAAEARVRALVNSVTLPPWWQTEAGQCRQNAISATCDPNSFGLLQCPDIWNGATTISVHTVTNSLTDAGFTVRLAGVLQSPGSPVPLTGDRVGQELVVGAIRILRSKTTGADACSGCLAGACFVLDEVKLVQPAGVGDYTLTYPASNNWVTYNDGIGWSWCFVPAVNRTWGAIKTLYR